MKKLIVLLLALLLLVSICACTDRNTQGETEIPAEVEQHSEADNHSSQPQVLEESTEGDGADLD